MLDAKFLFCPFSNSSRHKLLHGLPVAAGRRVAKLTLLRKTEGNNPKTINRNIICLNKGDTFMKNTILIVDNEPNVLAALQRTLFDEPYDVRTATSGEDALEILAICKTKL
jgi:PleD family two-component response regulator